MMPLNDKGSVPRFSRTNTALTWISRTTALLAVAAAIAIPIFYPATKLPEGFEYAKGTEGTFATADAAIQTVMFLSTVTFGIAAVTGFSVRNGIGNITWKREVNILLLSFITSCLSCSVIFAYDAMRNITMQLDAGNIFLNSIDSLLEKHGMAVWISALFSMAIFALNMKSDN